MSQALHILRKDLTRLRWLLLMWVALLIVRTACWSFATRPNSSFGFALLVSQLMGVLGALQTLMLALMAARLVHEEPLVGWDAFWLTRPYSRQALMGAKLLWAACVLVVLPLAADLSTMSIYHAGAGAQAIAAPTFISGYVTWALLLLALATVTSSLGAFVLTIVGGVAGLVTLAVVLVTVAVFVSEPSISTGPSLSNPIPSFVATLVLNLAMLAVIVYQYRHRRWRVAATIAAVGLLASVAAAPLWASAFGSPVAPDPGTWSHDPAASAAVVDRRFQAEFNRRTSLRNERQPRRQVYAPVRLNNMPRDMVIQSVLVDSTLTMSDGTVVRSRQADASTPPVHGEGAQGVFAAKRAALGDVTLVRGMNEGDFERWPALVTLDERDYARSAGRPGRLVATLQFHLNRIRLRGVLPLRTGAALDDGTSRIEVLSTEQNVDGLAVAMRRWRVFSPATTRDFASFTEFVLRNRSRQEGLTAGGRESLPTPSAGGLSVGGWSFFNPVNAMNRDAFAVQAEQLRYRNRIARPGEQRTFDAAWFDGAELAILETAYAGSVTRTVTIDDFVVPTN